MATTAVPPVSAPAAPSTPAPSTPAPAAPVTPAPPAPAPPATPTPTPEGGEPQSLGDRIAAGWAKAKADVPLDETTAPAPAAPAAPEAVVPAAPAPETPAAPAAPVVPAADPNAPQFTFDADEMNLEGLAPSKFNEFLQTSPELAKAFDANPAVKGEVFAALRERDANRELRQIIPDAATAKDYARAAGTYQRFDNAFLSAEREGPQSFLDFWFKEAQMVGGDGKPVMENGIPKFHPALGVILRQVRDDGLKFLKQGYESTGKFPEEIRPFLQVLQAKAKTSDNERLQTAVTALLEELGAPASTGLDALPDELKPHAERLQRERTALDEEKQTAARARTEQAKVVNQQSIDRVESSVVDAISTQLQPVLSKAQLSEAEQEWAWQHISNEIDKQSSEDPYYEAGYQAILLDEPSDAREKALKAHIFKYTQPKLPTIVKDVLRRAKSGALDRQAVRDTKVDDQRRASATDPRGTSIAPAAPIVQTPHQMRTEIVEAYQKANNNERPSMEYVIGEEMKRMNALPSQQPK